MNCCACLLLYALSPSCSDACGLKVGVSPGPAFGRITSGNNLLNGIASGIGPGPRQCSHRKPKEPCSPTGFQGTTAVSVLASAGGSAGRHCTTDAAPMESSFPSTDGASQVGCSQESLSKQSEEHEAQRLSLPEQI